MLQNFLLLSTVVTSGTCARRKFRFTPSDRLRNLRQRRPQVHDNATRKCLNFQNRRLHRKEFGQWKLTLLRKYLAHPARRKELQNISSYTSKPLRQHPPLDEFAMMLEKLFLHWNSRCAYATKSFDRGTLDIARTHGSS